jgi:hypothetical protein
LNVNFIVGDTLFRFLFTVDVMIARVEVLIVGVRNNASSTLGEIIITCVIVVRVEVSSSALSLI